MPNTPAMAPTNDKPITTLLAPSEFVVLALACGVAPDDCIVSVEFVGELVVEGTIVPEVSNLDMADVGKGAELLDVPVVFDVIGKVDSEKNVVDNDADVVDDNLVVSESNVGGMVDIADVFVDELVIGVVVAGTVYEAKVVFEEGLVIEVAVVVSEEKDAEVSGANVVVDVVVSGAEVVVDVVVSGA